MEKPGDYQKFACRIYIYPKFLFDIYIFFFWRGMFGYQCPLIFETYAFICNLCITQLVSHGQPVVWQLHFHIPFLGFVYFRFIQI